MVAMGMEAQPFPTDLAQRLAGDIIEKTDAHTVMLSLGLERMDLVSEGVTRGIRDWPKYDATKAKPQTFLYMAIRAGMFDYLRREGAEARKLQRLGGVLHRPDARQELQEWLQEIYDTAKSIYTAKRYRQGRKFFDVAQCVALGALVRYKGLTCRGAQMLLSQRPDLCAVLHLRHVPSKNSLNRAVQFTSKRGRNVLESAN